MFVCTLTLPGQNPDADLSENRTGFGLQNLPIAFAIFPFLPKLHFQFPFPPFPSSFFPFLFLSLPLPLPSTFRLRFKISVFAFIPPYYFSFI